MTHPNDELKACPFCGWAIVEIIEDSETKMYSCVCDNCAASGSPNHDAHGARVSWNARAKDEAKGGEAVAEVCYDSYGFGRMVWLKDFGKGNQPPHGSLLYTSPRPTAQADIGAAVTAFQLAEDAYTERALSGGLLFDPALSVEEGLLAALPHLQLPRPTADVEKVIKDHAKRINRCAEVEQVLFDIARGKRDLPTREECRQMAIRIGTHE